MTKDEMRQYIRQLVEGSEQWKAIKMVVLGNGKVGKTTLLRAFDTILHPEHGQNVRFSFFLFLFLANNKQQDEPIQSTIGADCHTLELAGGEVTVWDFAGQQEYTATHQFFLSNKVCSYIILP